MKKTSIFFLVISVILIITGIVLKNSALDEAEKENIELFRQTLTEDGNLIETFEFSIEDTNKINIDIKNANVNIIGNAEKSYAEIINFNALEYVSYSNNRAFTIQDDIISALIGRAEGGDISFNGVRDFIRFNKHNSEKTINIYIASTAVVKVFDIKIDNGNLNLDKANLVCDYVVSIGKGNITCKNTEEISLLDATVKNGNITLDKTYIQNSKVKIDNGNLDFITPSYIIYDYNVENETGDILYNDEIQEGVFITTNEGKNGIFSAHVGVGKISIKTFEQNSDQSE